MSERELTFSHAKKLLGGVCGFLKPGRPPADFVVPGREALILTRYTTACFPIDKETSYRFSGRSTEYLTLVSHRVEHSHVVLGPSYRFSVREYYERLAALDIDTILDRAEAKVRASGSR